MDRLLIVLFLVFAVPVVWMMAKANVDRYFMLKERFKERGLDWCMAELAIATSSEYKDALKGAISELHRSKHIV